MRFGERARLLYRHIAGVLGDPVHAKRAGRLNLGLHVSNPVAYVATQSIQP